MLKENPFFILGVNFRDNRDIVLDAFENKVSDETNEEAVLTQAQKSLLISKSRLEAEVKWFPDLSPKKISEIIKKQNDYKALQEIMLDLTGVSQANLVCYLSSFNLGDISLLKTLINAQESISLDNIKNFINSNRSIAGFPEVSSPLLENALQELKKCYTKLALQSIISSKKPENTMTQLIQDFSCADIEQRQFLERIAEQYDVWVIPKLRDFEDKIECLIVDANETHADLSEIVNNIIDILHDWDAYAQPSQLIFQAKNLDEPRSKKVFDKIRDFSLWLANEKQEHTLSLNLSKISKEIFFELPSVTNQLDEDIDTLEDLVQKSQEQENIAPLAIAIENAMKDDKKLVKLSNQNEFNLWGTGFVGDLYHIFISVIKKTQNTSYEETPWQLMRNFSIFIHNEKKNPSVAFDILSTLCKLNPPEAVIAVLNTDSQTIERNLLGEELRSVLENKKTIRAIEIIERLIILSKTQDDKQTLQKLLSNLKNNQAQSMNWIGWIIFGVFILFILLSK